RSTAGPISSLDGSASNTPVFPALTHFPSSRMYFSACFPLVVSTVKTVPSGNKVQPSSSYESCLFLPVIDQENVWRSNKAAAGGKLQQLASMKVPSGRMTLSASPVEFQPPGGATLIHLLASGA